jgi:PAS domain S-box-containing protein
VSQPPLSKYNRGFYIASIGVLLTIIMAAIYIWQPTFLVFLNHKTYDTLLRFVGQDEPSGRVVIVDVDERSVSRYGQWPWPRYRLARLLKGISDLGAVSVAVDFLLSESDRTSLSVIKEEMARELGVKIKLQGIDPKHQDNDHLLAEAFKSGPFVLGMKFSFTPESSQANAPCELRPLTVMKRARASETPARHVAFEAGGAVCNVPVLAQAATRQGFLNVGLDSDGVLRRAPLLIEYQDHLYPSLALAAYLQSLGLNQLMVHVSELGARAVQVRDNLIPVDARSRLLINYRDPNSAFMPVSAADLLEGKVDRDAIQGKLVVLGISAAGLKDLQSTPLRYDTTGVVIQANLLDNLIKRDYLSSPAYTPGLELALVALCGVFSAWFFTRLRAAGNLVLLGGGAALLFGLSVWSLDQYGLYWSPLWPGLTLAANFSLLNLARFWREERQVKSRTLELANTVTALRKEVSERQLAEEARAVSEERFRVLSEESPLGISVVDQDGGYEYLNPTFKKMFGYTLSEVPTGRDWLRLAFPQKDQRHKAIAAWFEDTSAGDEAVGRFRTFEVTCKDGGKKTILFRLVTLPNGKHFILYEDITERLMAEQEMRLLEEKLYQSQKMEALGVLAGGIAHDFNNVLQAISGYVQLISAEKSTSQISRERLHKVGQSADRAAGMIRQLMTMARKVETRAETVDLNQEIERTVEVLEHTLPRMINIRTNLDKRLKCINGDPGQVEQVLFNLATNASHAMPKGGELSLSTYNVKLSQDDCRTLPGLQPGEYVQLVVSDTGLGMDEYTREHIFEPFFTTKPSGMGTGLGLSTVYGIVTSHDGLITCRSAPEQGTSFKIYFPALRDQDELEPEPSFTPGKMPGGSETILVVDDEEPILESCQEALQTVGYEVLTANSGEGALEIYRAEPETVDLVILDLNMPGMGGLKCLESILTQTPQARIIVATGYADLEMENQINRLGGKRLIGKPYRFSDLMATVRQVLDED